MDHEIEATAEPRVADAIAGLGRTEDLRLSPDARRVAIACFEAQAVAVVDVELAAEATSPRVAHTAVATLVVRELAQPHGVDWLDERTLVVADRGGRVGLLAVPAAPAGEAVEVAVGLLPLEGAFAELYGPGSVRVTARADDHVEVLVCNNWGNQITRHRLDRGEPWRVASSEPCTRHLLDLPDGLATSPDGAWLAVSNHNLQTVVVYGGTGSTGPGADVERAPVGVLRGTSYPHGICFSPDGTQLLVADAGSRSVRHYRSDGGDWAVAGYPAADIPVLTADEFDRGNVRPDEGGPKGIDLDPTGRVMAMTAGAAPLRWFDLRAATSAPSPGAERAPYEVAALERETALKASLARAELRVMETEVREHDAQALASRTADRAVAAEQRAAALQADLDAAWRRVEEAERCADEAQEHLAAIQGTRLWRAAEPLRRAYGRVRARRAGAG